MSLYPSGTVTFLFTDIEGSTRLAQQYPEAMQGLLARHNAILGQVIHKHDGHIFQIVGDSFCSAFSSAIAALKAAMEAQTCLFTENWSPAPLKVRMGIHTGEAYASSNGQYSGYTTLALTQRIMSAGHGRQILLSGAARGLIRDTLPENTELVDLGEKRLKDLLRPEHLYQLNTTGLPATFPPLNTLDAFSHNLPVQLTTFIGREREIAEVKQILTGHRLVTLTGSGGTGKTRLALQVAADLLEKFDHGVWFVELAPLTDPELIPRAILSSIGTIEQQEKTPLEVLKEYLHDRQILLLLDNCEHLLSACAQISNALLSVAPGLRILASSREALGVKGEASYPVPSLELPDMKQLPVIEQLTDYGAIRLFIDRALLVAPHFVVDRENAPFIAQICYRLDGIPLAIELAAARIKVLSVEQISSRLDDRFHLLTGGARTSLPRQQTLRALIDWSYDILSEHERMLLQRLSVFAGGWTLEAAEEVCAGNGLELCDVLDLLTQLVNKSLVVLIEHTQSGERRYRMLETIRQYSREKLLQAGGIEMIRRQHLAYLIKLTKRAEPELYRSNQVFWSARLEEELDNLRTALEWALSTNAQAGLQIITASWMLWLEHGYLQELGSWLAQLLPHYKKSDALLAKALVIQSRAIAIQGDFIRSKSIGWQGVQIARTVGDRAIEGLGLLNLSQIIGFTGNLEECIPMLENSLVLLQESGDIWGQATAMSVFSLNNLDMEQSKSYLVKALHLYRDLGDLSGIADCLSLLAQKNLWTGNFSAAAQELEESLEITRQIGSQSDEAQILGYFGNLAYWQGNYRQARDYFEESIALGEKINFQMSVLWARVNRAYAVLKQGDTQQALVEFGNSIRHMQQAGVLIGVVFAIEGLASLYLTVGQPARAARLIAWGDAIRKKTGDHRPLAEQKSVDRDLAAIQAQLDEAEFTRISTEGRAMTIEQVIDDALSENR